MNIKMFDNSQNKYDDIDNLLYQILVNRGLEDPQGYLNLMYDEKSEHNPKLLDNIEKAVTRFLNAIDNNEYIHIIVDSDPDGYCSSAMLYNYTTKGIGYKNIGYSLHTGKQHGISEDIIIPDKTKLLVVPDAGR